MAVKSKLPNFQFPGQVVIDPYGVVYKYNEFADCFVNTGSVEDIVDSSFDDTGLMIPDHKGKLDLIPPKAGGFAFIIEPKLRPNSDDNPDGLIYGDVKLVSESLDINCIDYQGNKLSGCYSCTDTQQPPGFNFQLSEKFLKSFCARLPIIPGPRGDKGETGDQGEPGTGDGPQGETGLPGASYDTPGTFTGVKVLDVDGAYSQAVVDLSLDAESGVLTLQKSNIASADSDVPVGQIYSTPIVRDVVFNPEFPECDEGGDLWKYTITKGDDDLEENIYLYSYPDQFEAPNDTEVTTIRLSDLIDAVIADLMPDYEAAKQKYDDEIKTLLFEKDEESRQKLCSLAKELSDCEWELPLEYCLGITPAECLSAAGKIAEETKKAALAACEAAAVSNNLKILEIEKMPPPTGPAQPPIPIPSGPFTCPLGE